MYPAYASKNERFCRSSVVNSNQAVGSLRSFLKTGEEVTAKIVDFNEAEQKISLSIKALLIDQEKRRKEEEAAANGDNDDVATVDIEAAVAAAKAAEEKEEKSE